MSRDEKKYCQFSLTQTLFSKYCVLKSNQDLMERKRKKEPIANSVGKV